jgi:hypothetical protein
MKLLRSLSLATAIVIAELLLASAALSQTSKTSGADLTATSWLVTVDGETRTRTFTVTTGNLMPDGSTGLRATYGWTGGNMNPVQAQINQAASPRQLILITPADTKIVASERSDGSFQGTFSLKNGTVKSVIVTKIAGDIQVAAKKAADEQPMLPGVSHWASRPQLFVGDTWQFEFANKRYAKPGCQYRLSVERITGSSVYARATFPEGCEVSITTAYPIGQGTLQRFDLGLNHYHYSADPYPAFDFPLYVGKTWTRKWQFRLNGWSYNDTVAASVEAFEKVTTPAGTFDAYRVRLVRSYHGEKTGSLTQSGTLEDTFWYSPQVKYFVRRTFVDGGWAHITRELVSYSVNDGAQVLGSQSKANALRQIQ